MAAATSLPRWFAARVPEGWFTGPIDIAVDREEILVTGELPAARAGGDDDLACRARISAFRDETRELRMRIAAEAEARFDRKVSWAVRCGAADAAFTTASVPVMTRLRMGERATLDTLIDAGLARSRSEALAWCVRLVGQHESQWLDELRDALQAVDEVRAAGPRSSRQG
jgi:alkanesulfonate monooxygenase SsuD/methylene tetrahydromethanopterin reductase-like flavin-dependent oxidoreductase (luciferase family)